MIVSVCPGADPEAVRRELVARGLWVTRFEPGADAPGSGPLFLVRSYSGAIVPAEIERLPGVLAVARTASAHPLVDAHGPAARCGDLDVGAGRPPVVMAGPCSVESEDQIRRVAERVARAGVRVLRGGAYKPRTSPYEFQGHGERALRWLARAAREHGLLVVSEALSEASAPAVAEAADIVQVGSRNMHNTALLRAVGATRRPVLVKRGMAATVEEWLLAGEYALAAGAAGVVFCERGIRSFDDSTRNLLDLSAVALLAHVHRLPVVVDPSHALGRRDLIGPMSRAALAAGAAGLLVETHDEPGRALSDGPQALTADDLETLLAGLPGAAGAPSFVPGAR